MRRLGKKVLYVATGTVMTAGALVGIAAPTIKGNVKEFLNNAISAYFKDGQANTGALKIVVGENAFGKEGAAAALIAAAIATKAYTTETKTVGEIVGEKTIDPTQYVEVKGGECKVIQNGQPKVVVKINNGVFSSDQYQDTESEAYEFISENDVHKKEFDAVGVGTKTFDENDLPALLKTHETIVKYADSTETLKYDEEIELNLSKIEARYDEDENHHGIYYKVGEGAIKYVINFDKNLPGLKVGTISDGTYRDPPEIEILGYKYLVDLKELTNGNFVLYSGHDYTVNNEETFNITTNGHKYKVTIEVVKTGTDTYGIKATVEGEGYSDYEILDPGTGTEFVNGDDKISIFLKDTYEDKNGNWVAVVRIGEGKIKFEQGEPFPFDPKWIVDKVEIKDGYLKRIVIKNGYELSYDSATTDDGLKAGGEIPGLKTKDGKLAFVVKFPGLGSQSAVDLTNVEFRGINDKNDAVLGVKFTNAKGDVVDTTGVSKAKEIAIPANDPENVILETSDDVTSKLSTNSVYYYYGNDSNWYKIVPTDLNVATDTNISFEVTNLTSGTTTTVTIDDNQIKEIAPGFVINDTSPSSGVGNVTFKVINSVSLVKFPLILSINDDNKPKYFFAVHNSDDYLAYFVKLDELSYDSDDNTFTVKFVLPGSEKQIVKVVKPGEWVTVDLGDGEINFDVTAYKNNDGYKYVLIKPEAGTTFRPTKVLVGDKDKMDKKTYLDLTHMVAVDADRNREINTGDIPAYIKVYGGSDDLLGGNSLYVVYDAWNDDTNGKVEFNAGSFDYTNSTSVITDGQGTGIEIGYYNSTTNEYQEIADQTIDNRNYDENKYQITGETIEVSADGDEAKLVIPDEVRDAVVGITAYSPVENNNETTTTKELTVGQEINGVKIVKIETPTCEAQATQPTVTAKELIKVPQLDNRTETITKPIKFNPADLITFDTSETGIYTIYVGTPLTNPALAKEDIKKDFREEGGIKKSEIIVDGNKLYVVGGDPDAVYEAAKELIKILTL